MTKHISFSQLKNWAKCPFYHKLVSIDKIEDAFSGNIYTAFGTAMHTTIEKFLLPIQAQKTVMITGYTHPPYRQKTIDLLNHLPSLDGYLLVRGMEGSAQAPLDKRCPAIVSVDGTIEETFIRPNDFSFDEIERVSPNTALSVEDTLEYSLTAFDKDSEAFKHLAFQAMAIITSLQLADQKSIRTKLNHPNFITNFKQRWERY